ncbi:keratin, type I cytoskeletal 9-like [Scylla paramamosain]|uniref:keratin, type I cytoskeletal 9-like n=1 Tax=Scylla paramamosain TaxID=85552 RepID=UPI003082CF4D
MCCTEAPFVWLPLRPSRGRGGRGRVEGVGWVWQSVGARRGVGWRGARRPSRNGDVPRRVSPAGGGHSDGARHVRGAARRGAAAPPSELQGGKKSGGGPSRTSRSGLLPSPVVWGSDAPQPSFLTLLHNGGANVLLDGYDGGGGGGGGRGGGAAARAALANGERSSDSEDSGATSGATSGKEASPGCEESSGSEQSSAPPHEDSRHDEDQSSPAPARSRAALPRSRTTPMLNGGATPRWTTRCAPSLSTGRRRAAAA